MVAIEEHTHNGGNANSLVGPILGALHAWLAQTRTALSKIQL
jgi:hypothetical protein